MRRFLRAAAPAALLMILLLYVSSPECELRRGQPNPIALWQFDHATNDPKTGPITLMWSIETFNNSMSVEGPSGDAAPSEIRVVQPGGAITPSRGPTHRLDPAVNVSVCFARRPPKGATWWSDQVPTDMAQQLRATSTTFYRLEARVGDNWLPVNLIDSGCRGQGRF